jgi:nucleoside-diphosphate-sugar epimerase
VKVLVTGGHGFVGSHLVERLVAQGADVRCLSRRAAPPERLAGLPVEIVPGDLESGAGLDAAVRGVREVWHLGALTRSRTRRQMDRVNHEATLALARLAAREPGLERFVFCSSLAAVGASPDGRPLTEQAPRRPATTYGRSKRAAEVALEGLGDALPWVALRPPGVYGPRDKDFLSLFRAAAQGLLPLLGPASRRLSLIHVGDLADGLLAVGRAPGALRRAWFVTADPPVTQGALALALSRAVGRRVRTPVLPTGTARLLGSVSGLLGQLSSGPPLLTRERIAEVGEGHWICSGAAAAALCGWRAPTPLEEGLAATAAWYRAEGLLA